jgi:hypothetical protein
MLTAQGSVKVLAQKAPDTKKGGGKSEKKEKTRLLTASKGGEVRKKRKNTNYDSVKAQILKSQKKKKHRNFFSKRQCQCHSVLTI